MMISTVVIDLVKTSLHAVAMDTSGKVVQRRKLGRAKLVESLANQAPRLIGMEACAGAHHLARTLSGQGHDVRLMPGQYVQPFVKTHKNDLTDAEAICEAVQRPQMRFVPIKTGEQLDVQALHRARDRLVAMRTALINQIRGFLLSAAAVGAAGARSRALTPLDMDLSLVGAAPPLLERLRAHWQAFYSAISHVGQQILTLPPRCRPCHRL